MLLHVSSRRARNVSPYNAQRRKVGKAGKSTEHITAPFRLYYILSPILYSFPNRRFVVIRSSVSGLKEKDMVRCRRGQVGNRFRLTSNPPSEKLRFSKNDHAAEGRRAMERDFCSDQLPRSHARRENTVSTLYQSPSNNNLFHMSCRKYCH